MSNVIRFPARRVRRFSARLLTLSASSATSKPPPAPEALGNLLQRLARERPAAVLLLQNVAADMLAHLRDGS